MKSVDFPKAYFVMISLVAALKTYISGIFSLVLLALSILHNSFLRLFWMIGSTARTLDLEKKFAIAPRLLRWISCGIVATIDCFASLVQKG